VHLVVKLDGIPVEVQVRTVLQHAWAQSMERLGDAWGRAIRYGGEPDDSERHHGILPGGAEKPRRAWVALLKELSTRIETSELSPVRVVTLVEVKDVPGAFTLEQVLDCFRTARL